MLSLYLWFPAKFPPISRQVSRQIALRKSLKKNPPTSFCREKTDRIFTKEGFLNESQQQLSRSKVGSLLGKALENPTEPHISRAPLRKTRPPQRPLISHETCLLVGSKITTQHDYFQGRKRNGNQNRRVPPCAVKTCAVRPVFARMVGELRAADPSNVQGPVKQNASPGEQSEGPRPRWKPGQEQNPGPENQDNQHMLEQPRVEGAQTMKCKP